MIADPMRPVLPVRSATGQEHPHGSARLGVIPYLRQLNAPPGRARRTADTLYKWRML